MLSRPKVQESGIAPDKDGRNLKLADNPDTGLLRGLDGLEPGILG